MRAALVLTLVGLYGVIAYSVARRTNEIGVRMALGASAGKIVRLVVQETGVMLVAGLLIGIGLALAAGRQASALLFNVPPYDPWLLLAAIALLSLVAIVASAAVGNLPLSRTSPAPAPTRARARSWMPG